MDLAADVCKHMVGNPVFAIETNLEPLRKRIVNGNVEEALQILKEIEQSVNRIKDFLGTFNDNSN
jgi:uncharacterized protein YcgL (UPF0745 family)